jgi:hypothetical protein
MENTNLLSGVVHGSTIQLDQDVGLPEGQRVTVIVQPEVKHIPGEGLRRSFGAWAEDAEELDEYLEWSRQQRKIGRPEIEP